jgi:dihydrolipoamide dehydrogenase
MKKYDAIIIGSGQAGNPLAKKLAAAGWKTAVVERALAGGTCINYGCTPTKTMIASARVAYLARKGKEYGVPLQNFKVDIKAVVARKNKVVAQFHESTEKQLKAAKNIDLIYSKASFIAEKLLGVIQENGQVKEITADKIFINTGARTSIPKIEGLDTIDYLTSTTILDITEIPKHLLILGGGYIGLEFGQMFSRFGSKVTILDSSPRFLPREDEDVAAELKKILEEDGITIYTGAKAEYFKKTASQISVRAFIDKEVKFLQCSHVLVAAGRTPNTDDLGLEAIGLDTDARGYINVNNKLETNIKGIYALGDVKGGPAFTHISYNDQEVVVENLLHKGKATIKNRQVPYCVFTDPQLGRIGITEQQAKEQGLKIKVTSLPMAYVARAIETGDTRGLMKAVVDAKTGKILGAAVLGTEGGEMMTVLQMAMAAGMTYKQLREFIFAHPLWSESINNLFMSLDK